VLSISDTYPLQKLPESFNLVFFRLFRRMRAVKKKLLAVNSKETREPRPSIVSAPRMFNSFSIPENSMFARVGVSKIESRVFCCFRFTKNDSTVCYHMQKADLRPVRLQKHHHGIIEIR